MKTKTNSHLYTLTLLSAVVATTNTQASSDYGPAIWNPACNGHWYASGYGHKFHVIHDMEGYYLSTISYFQNCATSASVHYCVNGLKDTSTDHAAGEITQMVLEAYYAWHVLCWNQYCTGTEHEGFASNPAWYTEAQYQASAGISAHVASKFGFAADRNHIVGHNEWQNANWKAYAGPAFGINTTCNTHTDPGPYWDWNHYMSLLNPIWTFDGDAQGWYSVHNIAPLTWTACCGWPGIIYADQWGDDPYIYSPATSFTGGNQGAVNVSLYAQNGNTDTHDLQLFWSANNGGGSTPTVTYKASNSWAVVNLDVDNLGWAGKTVTLLRLDFDGINHGNRWIVNHIIPQTAPKFYFGSTTEGWTLGHGLTGLTWTACCGWPGIIYADQNADDAYLYSPPIGFWGGCNDVLNVRIYPQNGTTANHDLQLFWSADGGVNGVSSAVNYTAQNNWINVTIPLGSYPLWNAHHITSLRLDLDSINHGNRWIIDYVLVQEATSQQ